MRKATSSFNPVLLLITVQVELQKQYPRTTSKRRMYPWIPTKYLFFPALLLPKLNFSRFRPCIAKCSLKTALAAILLSFLGGWEKRKELRKTLRILQTMVNVTYCRWQPQSKQEIGLETSRGSFWLCVFVILCCGFFMSLSWNQVLFSFPFIMVFTDHFPYTFKVSAFI